MKLDDLAKMSYDEIQRYPGNRGRWLVTLSDTKQRHRAAALAVARAVLEEAAARCRLAKHGEIAAANIAMLLSELEAR